MNETTASGASRTQEQVFVWRRLEDPLTIFGKELPWWSWLVVLGVVLGVAIFYVVWMYIKDSRGVGLWWAGLLGLLRTSVYAALALIFLLPSNQTFIDSQTESKVVVVFDVSGSMFTSDDLPDPTGKTKPVSRQERTMEFLFDEKIKFIQSLEEKNPVTVYRLGARLDEFPLHFAKGQVWVGDERTNPQRDTEGKALAPDKKPLHPLFWRDWLAVNANPKMPDKLSDQERRAFAERYRVSCTTDLSDYQRKQFYKLSDANKKAFKEGLTKGTNLGDSLVGIINKEANNRVQGIVVFTDGRNTEGSPNAFRQLEQRAKSANIPIFVVGIGEDRQKVKIEIVDLRLPGQIQPEDKFRTVAEVTGEGLAGKKADITLEITHVRTVKKSVPVLDGNNKPVIDPKTKKPRMETKEIEEFLPLELIEQENKDDPKAKRIKIPLGNKLELKPNPEAVFDKSQPPRVEVEWQLDAAALAALKKIDLNVGEYKGKKWEIAETKDDSEWKFQLKIPTDKREGKLEKFHLSNKTPFKIIKKPIRVLLMAAAANRDYQFVRTLLVREAEKKRIQLAIHLQLPPGRTKWVKGVVQDVPPERLLTSYPSTFGKKKDLDDLESYDVIVAFDPDWNRLSAEQMAMTRRWADKGGGLVLLGGYINTVELIKPRDGDEAERFKPILDLLPVVLADRRRTADRKAETPWPLSFEGANPDMEFLRLDETLDVTKFKEDWSDFFYKVDDKREEKATRGFYSFYPIEKVKTGSIVVARFLDPGSKLRDNSFHPYIVMSPDTLARVIWIGSAETWRLREYREAYHERFWTKLVRYAAAKSKGPGSRPIRMELGKLYKVNRPIDVDARIEGPGGEPLDRKVKPEISLKMPADVPENAIKLPIFMTPRPGARDGWFSGRFQLKHPGTYELTIKVPKQRGQENDETETTKFVVQETDPELDNTRPDFVRMYRMATEADNVLSRMTEGDRNELKRRLQRPKLNVEEGGDKTVDTGDDKLRLYFDLKNGELVPRCMIQDVQKARSRGPVHDLWDDGVTIYEYPKPDDPSKEPKQPIKLSYALIVIIGLLSMEWLIRKLLRLA